MATYSKRPGSRLTIIVIVLLAVSASVIAMWRVSTTSTVQEAPYFPPGHIQIASNKKPESPSEESNAPASQAGESTTGAGQAPESVNPSGPSAAISQPASAVASAAPAAQVAQVARPPRLHWPHRTLKPPRSRPSGQSQASLMSAKASSSGVKAGSHGRQLPTLSSTTPGFLTLLPLHDRKTV